MGAKLATIFIIIIVLGVGLYIYNSGTIGKGVNLLKSIAPPPAATSSPENYAPPTTPVTGSTEGGGGGGTAETAETGGTETSPAPATSTINPADIPPGFTADQLSPYFHEIRFGGLGAAPPPQLGSTAYGQITLYTSYENPSTTVDVTGWEIRTNRGGVFIPKAVNVYDPLGLNPQTDILMKNGDTLNIYSSSAPVNLRLNECIGYLPNRDQFNPELPQICPPIDRTGIESFSGACQNYILSLNGCRSPDMSSPEIPAYDYSCKQYLAGRFNYRWCFDTYFSDPNFLSHEIDVWTGSSPLDQYHDQVELLDKNGLLVDFSSY